MMASWIRHETGIEDWNGGCDASIIHFTLDCQQSAEPFGATVRDICRFSCGCEEPPTTAPTPTQPTVAPTFFCSSYRLSCGNAMDGTYYLTSMTGINGCPLYQKTDSSKMYRSKKSYLAGSWVFATAEGQVLYVSEKDLPKGTSNWYKSTTGSGFLQANHCYDKIDCSFETLMPTVSPTISDPTQSPTLSQPSIIPSIQPSFSRPSAAPTTLEPTIIPTGNPTKATTDVPSSKPLYSSPSLSPNRSPTQWQSTDSPTHETKAPLSTGAPSPRPTVFISTLNPSHETKTPLKTTSEPSNNPTAFPTHETKAPLTTRLPSSSPSLHPTHETKAPLTTTTAPTTMRPTNMPTYVPTNSFEPSRTPFTSTQPTVHPTHETKTPLTTRITSSSPSTSPTRIVTSSSPSTSPSLSSNSPTFSSPSNLPSTTPTFRPSFSMPTEIPTQQPSSIPSAMPTTSFQPSSAPTEESCLILHFRCGTMWDSIYHLQPQRPNDHFWWRTADDTDGNLVVLNFNPFGWLTGDRFVFQAGSSETLLVSESLSGETTPQGLTKWTVVDIALVEPVDEIICPVDTIACAQSHAPTVSPTTTTMLPSTSPSATMPTPMPSTTTQPSASPSTTTTNLPSSSPIDKGSLPQVPVEYQAGVLEHIQPEVQFSGTVGALPLEQSSYDGESAISAEFGGLKYLASGSTAHVGLVLNDRAVYTHSRASITRSNDPPTSIRLMVQTPELYSDRKTLSLIYQLKSADGLTKVERSGITILLHINGHYVKSCSTSMNANSGVSSRSCTYDFSESVFSTSTDNTAEVHLSMCLSGTCVQSQTETVTLHQKVAWSTSPNMGMMGVFVQSPHYGGESVTISIYANTGGNSLGLWWPKIEFNTNYLTYSRASIGSLWEEPVMLLSTSEVNVAGVLEAYSESPKSGVSNSDVIGTHLHLIDFTFIVRDQGSDVDLRDVMSLVAVTMTDTSAIDMLANVPGQIVSSTGTSSTASLTIKTPEVLDYYLQVTRSNIYNKEYFTAETSHYDFPAYAVYHNRVGSVQNPPCLLDVVPHSNRCRFTVNQDTQGGMKLALIGTRSYTFKVWIPTDVTLTADKILLQPISGTSLFTEAELSLSGKWMMDNIKSETLLMNDLVDFTTMGPISVSGNTVTANDFGVGMVGVPSTNVDPVVFNVYNNAVSVVRLYPTVVTGVEMSVVEADDSFKVTGVLDQRFQAEGESGIILVNALLNDGSVQDVTKHMDFEFAIFEGTTSLEIHEDNGQYEVMIGEGADSYAGYFLEVAMMNEDEVLATGYPFINVSLPLAESVDVWSQCSGNKLTRVGDLANPIFGVRTSCQFYIRLVFPGGHTKFMEADSRTQFDYPEANIEISDSGLVSAIADSRTDGDVTVEISFPTYLSAAHLSTSFTFKIVSFSHIEVAFAPYPSYIAGYESATFLNKIHCSDVYERSQATVTGFLGDGSSLDITSNNDISITSSDVGVVSVSDTVLIGESAGATTIYASIDSFESAPVSFMVVDYLVFIVGIEERTFGNKVFTGAVDTSKSLILDVTLVDGAFYPNALTHTWTALDENLQFTSDSDAVKVSDKGVLTLKKNSPLPINVEIKEHCANGMLNDRISTVAEIMPNLLADSWDVDIDMVGSSGLQFEPKNAGDSFTTSIRVNANSGALVTFSLKIWYDPEMLRVTGCSKSGAWEDKSFESNTESTLGEILLVGIGGNSAGKISTSGMIEITQCSFEVIASDSVLSRVYGYVSELTIVENNVQSTVGDYYLFAGDGLICLNAGVVEKVYEEPSRARRRLQSCSGHVFDGDSICDCEVPGDVSNDCQATPYDAQVTTYYMASATKAGLLPIDQLTDYQRKQMDPNADYQFGDTDCIVGAYSAPCPNGGSDVTYILRYLVKKYHWIDFSDPDNFATFDDGILTLRISFTRFLDKTAFEDADGGDTNVFFEIHTDSNQGMTALTGSIVEVNGAYVKAQAEPMNGEFIFRAEGLVDETITAVALMETVTASGATNDDMRYGFRQSALYGNAHKALGSVTIETVSTTISTSTVAPDTTTQPSTMPSLVPTARKTTHCTAFETFDSCRSSSCAWDAYTGVCSDSCTNYQNVFYGGVHLFKTYTCPTFEKCERACLEDILCKHFSFVTLSGMGECYIYGDNIEPFTGLGSIAQSGTCAIDLPSTEAPTETSAAPTDVPKSTVSPTQTPSDAPTTSPTSAPSDAPSTSPSETPSHIPTRYPSLTPSDEPTPSPTSAPSLSPQTSAPSHSEPTVTPSEKPTISEPTKIPTSKPSMSEPTYYPTVSTPTFYPTVSQPTDIPSTSPTHSLPTASPATSDPSPSPTSAPTENPVSSEPSHSPIVSDPSKSPTKIPSASPHSGPSTTPTSSEPTIFPTDGPTNDPSFSSPTEKPSEQPSEDPTYSSPTFFPTISTPTFFPTVSNPTDIPSSGPTTPNPTKIPTENPTNSEPTDAPSSMPSEHPTPAPTSSPTDAPSISTPSQSPTKDPSDAPHSGPSKTPVTSQPTEDPTENPTPGPSVSSPTERPTTMPSERPTSTPSSIPTKLPTDSPTDQPTVSTPTFFPTISTPTFFPSVTAPTEQPSFGPTASSPTENPASSSPSKSPEVSSPTISPSVSTPTEMPTFDPSDAPHSGPSKTPISSPPSGTPTDVPTMGPTLTHPTGMPIGTPSLEPTHSTPTYYPTISTPTFYPTMSEPTDIPSQSPTTPNPTFLPTHSRPTFYPTISQPTFFPTVSKPTEVPSFGPTVSTPTEIPSTTPTDAPATSVPTVSPSSEPSEVPSFDPSVSTPTKGPTIEPTDAPQTSSPTEIPSQVPSKSPVTSSPVTSRPTDVPSLVPSEDPSLDPSTSNPSGLPTTSPTSKPTDSPITPPTDGPSLSPSILIKSKTVKFIEPQCSDLCGSMRVSSCLDFMARDFKSYLSGRGSNVMPTVACGSIIVEVTGPVNDVDLAVQILSSGCIDLPNFASPICGPVEIEGEVDPTIQPSEIPSKIPSEIPSKIPSVSPSFVESVAVSDTSDDGAVFEVLGYGITLEYILYASAGGLLFICCLCLLMFCLCCRCMRKRKEAKKKKEKDQFYNDFQATPGTSTNYDDKPLPPAPIPVVGRWARRRSSGLGQLVSESFADLPRQRSEGSMWEENLHHVGSTFEDTSEFNIYGSYQHGREPGLSVDHGASWNHQAPDANIFLGSASKDRRVSAVSDLGTPKSTPGGGFSFYPGLGGEASYVTDNAYVGPSYGGARSPSNPDLIGNERHVNRRPSIIDGNVVPPAPISPRAGSRRSSMVAGSRRSSRAGFNLPRTGSRSRASSLPRRRSSAAGILPMSASPRRRSSVRSKPRASLPFVGSPRTGRKGTASRAETPSVASSQSSPQRLVKKKKEIQGEESFEELEKILLPNPQQRPPTHQRFYENASLADDIITEDDDMDMDGGAAFDDADLGDSEPEPSFSEHGGGAAFDDAFEAQEKKVEVDANASGTYYENATVLLDDEETEDSDNEDDTFEYTEGQKVEYSMNGKIWNVGVVISLDPVKVKGENAWISKEYPFIRPYVEGRKTPSVAAAVSLKGAQAVAFLSDMSDVAPPAPPTSPPPKANASPKPNRRMPEVSTNKNVKLKRAPKPSSMDTDSTLTLTEPENTHKRQPSVNQEFFDSQKRSNRFESSKRDASLLPRSALPQLPVPPKKRDGKLRKQADPRLEFTGKRNPLPLIFGKRDAAVSTVSHTSVEDSMDLRSSLPIESYQSDDTLRE